MAGYGDDAAFITWLAGYGYSLPEGAPSVAVLRQRGSAYIDGTYAARFPGTPTGGLAQERAWPRTGAETTYGESIGAAVTPTAVVEASYVAAYYEAQNPDGLAVTATAAGAIKREKVGSLETEYFEGSGSAVANATPVLSAVEGLLAALLTPTDFPAVLVV